MRIKQENFLTISGTVASDAMIEGCKEALKEDAELGYKGKYVPNSIVFKVYEHGGLIYVSAEWEEETGRRKKKDDQGAED